MAGTIRVVIVAALLAAIFGASNASGGTFPGRNGALVFDAVNVQTKSVQIFRVSAGGSGLKQLTSTTGAVWNEDPSFSANGKRIYFDSLDRSTTNPALIYRMNSNGTGRQRIDRANAPDHVWPSANRSGTSLAV